MSLKEIIESIETPDKYNGTSESELLKQYELLYNSCDENKIRKNSVSRDQLNRELKDFENTATKDFILSSLKFEYEEEEFIIDLVLVKTQNILSHYSINIRDGNNILKIFKLRDNIDNIKPYAVAPNFNNLTITWKDFLKNNGYKIVDIASYNNAQELFTILVKLASEIRTAKNEYKKENTNNQQTQPTQNMPQEIKINSVNTILYGPPGTGKTYHTINLACQVLSKKEELTDNRTDLKEEYESLIKEGRIMFTTFHQSMSYEDFIEGIKPCIENDEVTYKVQDGIFKKICHKAKADPDNHYMLIIDEINRGNVASIFGELITLIEDSKRAGADEAISVILPYSNESFSVPKNLYILGTMNTADRSVEALDAALRRRFDFIEMLPQTDDLLEIDGINLKDVLKTINARIEALLDRNHLIGHAYLINAENKNDIAQAFNNKIIPLLQEYFYGNYDRIAMVLGNSFITANDVTKNFANDINDIDLSDKKTYTFPKQNEDSIVNAIIILLGKPNAKADESEA